MKQNLMAYNNCLIIGHNFVSQIPAKFVWSILYSLQYCLRSASEFKLICSRIGRLRRLTSNERQNRMLICGLCTGWSQCSQIPQQLASTLARVSKAPRGRGIIYADLASKLTCFISATLNGFQASLGQPIQTPLLERSVTRLHCNRV